MSSSSPVIHVPDHLGSPSDSIDHLYIRQTDTKTDVDTNKPYTIYRIELHAPVRIWSVWKRYSDFVTLNAEFLALFPQYPPPGKLPSKTYFYSTVNYPSAVEERRKGLEAWLRSILVARESRWRESNPWREFLSLIPTSQSLHRTNSASSDEIPKNRLSASSNKKFTSESWLDEASDLSAVGRQIRTLLNRRDAILAKGDAVSAASTAGQARTLLTSFGSRLAILQSGLQLMAPDGVGNNTSTGSPKKPAGGPGLMSEGEYTRRHDMVQRLKDERETLSKLATEAVRTPSSPFPKNSSHANDRNSLFQRRDWANPNIWEPQAGGDLLRPSKFSNSSPSPKGSRPASGARRIFGSAAPNIPLVQAETETTRQLDNEGLLSLQKQIIEQQDQQVEGFSSLLLRQKHIGLAIAGELDTQNTSLAELDTDMDSTQGKLRLAEKKLKKMQK